MPEPGSDTALLEEIRRESVPLRSSELDSFCSLIDAGEGELAWEILVYAADAQGVSRAVWDRLASAAERMSLDGSDELYGDAVRVTLRHRSSEPPR